MARPLRILHLEDSLRDAEIVRDKLDAGGLACDILLATGKESFETALAAEPFDLIISDYNVPGYDGVSALARAQARQPDVPVILVSGTVVEEQAVTCLHLGATDYLLKERMERLVPAVRRALEEAETRRARRLAEAAVREERDRAQRYLDTPEVILLALDLEGRVTLVNRYACALLGRTAGELIGRYWVETCLPPRIREAVRAKLLDVLGGDLSVVENPIITLSGEERIIEWRPSLLRDGDGRVIGSFSSGADVTERSRAVEALRAAEERTRFVLQNANVGVWDMDYPTGVLRWSDVMEDQYGFARGTFGGTFEAFIERVHPDDRVALLVTIQKAVKTGADFSVLHRSLWPDGTVRWMSGVGRVLLGDDGAPVRAVGVSQDVTERRALEEQYQQAQKMEAVGRLAAGVAHDFNNLLTVILGFCGMLLENFDPADPRQDDIREIEKAGLRAAGLTKQLLTFSRKAIIEPMVLDVNAIVTEIRVLIGRLIGEDVGIVLTLEPALALVKADRGQVEQVILNLAVNARDAMPKGGTLTIATANVECSPDTPFTTKPGPCITLTVTDTGTGIAPEVLPRLFEPFFTTKAVGKGTGLGLATVHGIVNRSGGSVTVDSELGKGTSFRVYFPVADAADMAVAAPPVVAARAPVGVQTVLVVEDADGLRELTKRVLQRQGYTVLLAANAAEARERFDQNPSIDLLLTDVVMPGASGPELVAQILKDRPTLKVIYMSGYTDDAIVHHGVLAPGIEFLNKPFTAEGLGRKIKEVLGRAK